MSNTASSLKPFSSSSARRIALLVGAVAVWAGLYTHLEFFADQCIVMTGLAEESALAEALHFFIYEVPKVLLLLTAVVYVMGIIHTYVSPERTRTLLSGKRTGIGNMMAAGLGVLTPFCSCSAIPLFIGFLQAGVPLGVTFSFLIAAPMVNEIALALLFGMFGWKIATLYMVMGLTIAIVSGIIIGKLGLEHLLEAWVQKLQNSQTSTGHALPQFSWDQRMDEAISHVRSIVGKVWLYIVIGVGVGAGIHGYVPQDFMAMLMGKEIWWSVPAAVLIGVPMYSNAAGILPVVQALLGKGAALGTVMAFMMSVIALSLPEMIILRKVLKPQLIVLFAGIVALGIIIVGFAFNLVL